MLSGASMPSDEIMVAQLGPRPLLGGAILARPRGWGATVGRSAPRAFTRRRCDDAKFGEHDFRRTLPELTGP